MWMITLVAKAPQPAIWRLLHRLADESIPELRATFLQAVAQAQNGTVLTQVSAALARGDLAAAEALIPWESIAVETLEASLPETLRGVVNGAAEIATNGLARVIPDVAVSIRFDLVNRHAVDWAATQAAELVTAITEETRAAIRSVIVRGQRDGLSPDMQAREIRDLVGLTERDAGAVQNLRATLVEAGRKESVVERTTERYADRLLARRGENIARTETLTAANTGNRLLNEEALSQGLLDHDSRQRWLITSDERLCAYCREIKRLNADGVPIGRPFRTPDGPLDAPPAHPSCRCAVAVAP